MIEIEGIVFRAQYARGRGETEYTITNGSGEYTFLSRESIPPGSCMRIEGEMDEQLRIIPKKIATLGQEEARKVYGVVETKIKSSFALPEKPQLLADDETMQKLWPSLREVAAELLCAKKLRRSVLLRFHGDADGICGAFALTGIINCKAYQQNSAIYGVRDALRDIGTVGQENRPMVILLDFGSNDASAEGLGLLRAAGIRCILIDHHPLGSNPPPETLSPFRFAEKASKYTAGYLACEIAAACGMNMGEAAALAKAACAGDKSDILPHDGDDVKKAMVLDFLASHVSFGNNLDFYKNVMAKEELFASIANQAEESIEEAAQKAMAGMKRVESGKLETAVFSLGKVVKRGEWPPSSKVTTRIYDKLRQERGDKPLICIGYTEHSIIMRLNDDAVTLGLSANGLAEKLKATMADFVEGGGGHVKAGAIRVKKGFVKEVVNELVREIGGSG